MGNPEELWSAFKTTILDVTGGCLGIKGVLALRVDKEANV